MKNIIIFLTFLFSQGSYAKYVLTAEAGLALYSSEEMEQYRVAPSGSTQSFSFGIIDYSYEYGIYFSSSNAKKDVVHDGEDVSLGIETSSFGAFINYYMSRLFLGVGLGKATLSSEVNSELGGPRESIIKELYGLEDESSSMEIVLSGGYSLIRFQQGSIFVKGEYRKYASSSNTNITLGLKIKIL